MLACCGGMVIVAGLERMTFEVLRVLGEGGAAVHCVVNEWENHRIVALAEQVGASWSTGSYRVGLSRHTRNPLKLARMLWDILRISGGLLRDSWRFRPTHILMPDFMAVLRNAPALLPLRLLRKQIILRVGNHPEATRLHAFIWGWVLTRFVDYFVPNSQFGAVKLSESGVPSDKIVLIHNAVRQKAATPDQNDELLELIQSRRTLLCVGQIAPFKGTHLFVEAALRLLREGYDVQAVIIGRFPAWPPEYVDYFRQMRDAAAEAKLERRVLFIGECQNVLDLMRASYILAAPIVQEETFGNVALEAKSVGLPVVAFPTGGLLELVEHGVTGYLCEGSDVEQLVKGLKFFLDSPAEREKASAASLESLARPDSKYRHNEFRRRWLSLFNVQRV